MEVRKSNFVEKVVLELKDVCMLDQRGHKGIRNQKDK